MQNGQVQDEHAVAHIEEYVLHDIPEEQQRWYAIKLFERDEKVYETINISADKEALIKRISGRRVCKTCAAPYHVELMPSKVEDVCDLCGGELVQRKDDTVEVLNERLDAYQNQTFPLIAFYKDRDLCKDVDGLQSIDEVFTNIQDILKGE